MLFKNPTCSHVQVGSLTERNADDFAIDIPFVLLPLNYGNKKGSLDNRAQLEIFATFCNEHVDQVSFHATEWHSTKVFNQSGGPRASHWVPIRGLLLKCSG